MMWKLFIDDLRPCPEGFVLALSSDEAKKIVEDKGMPSLISFDHDLGDTDTTIVFLNWLIENYYDSDIPDYIIHSANPVGAENIRSKMESWRKSRAL